MVRTASLKGGPKKNSLKIKVGVAILVFSWLMTPLIILTQFLHLEAKVKVAITTVLIIIGNVTFYGGGFLIGKELFARYKTSLNPRKWFIRKVAGTKRNDADE